MSGQSANRSVRRQLEKKVVPKITQEVSKKLANNKTVQAQMAKQASKAVRKEIKTRVLGQLEGINYAGALAKYGPRGKEMVEDKAELCEDKAKFYALCQALPSVYQSKIPDGYRRKTAKYHSHRTFEIRSGTSGQFAFCVQPKIGNFDDPFHFQVALVLQDALNNPQNYDFQSVSAYQAFVQGVDTDIRVDPNFTALTANEVGFAHFVSSVAGTGAKPFSASAGQAANSYNNQVLYDGSGTNSIFKFPKGNYYIQLMCFCTNGDTSSGGIWNITNTGGSWTNDLSEIVTGTTPAITRSTKGIIYNATSDINFLTITANVSTTNTAQAVICPILPNNTFQNIDSGLISTIRPTAMSVLTSYIGPSLLDGGMIAGALLPGAALLTNYFTNDADDPGAFRDWETIATLTEAMKDNPLKKGNYTTWRQDSVLDYELFQPGSGVKHPYPGICVAGIWNPGSLITDQAICRVEIDIVFEMQTEKTLLPKDSYLGSQSCLDMANQYLASIPISSENETHVEIFKRWFGYVAKAAQVFAEVAPLFL